MRDVNASNLLNYYYNKVFQANIKFLKTDPD